MKTSGQDAVFHQEGDVWTHTCMVVEQMLSGPDFRTISPERRQGLLIAAILHDVAKPATRDEHFDVGLGRTRVTNHGHSNMGARDSWAILWKAELPLDLRLQVFALIAAHQKPFHIAKKQDMRSELAKFSIVGNWRELLALAKADNLGRISPNTEETAEILELLHAECNDLNILDGEWPFENDIARAHFVKTGDVDRLYFTPRDPQGSRVVVMSALPGAGKDTYIRQRLGDLPVVSLDALREEMGVVSSDDQGQVAQASLERARRFLRAKQDFVWNAVNTSKLMRSKAVDLCMAYDAHVSIHALDCAFDLQRRRNRERDAVVPQDAIDRLVMKWEPPMKGEAHEIIWVDAETFDPVVSQDMSPSP